MNTENTSNTQLTDEQIEYISEQMDNEIKGTSLEDLANMPSNQGKLERSAAEITEVGEQSKVAVMVDPNTGEHKIVGPADDNIDEETFEEMAQRIQNNEISFNESPITEEEIINHIANTDNSNQILSEVCGDIDLPPESIKKLLEIVNRKINREEFNVYREFPEEIKEMVNKYMTNGSIPLHSKEGKQFRNMISEQLIQEFITNINMDRIKHDFSKELEDLFAKGSNELADSIIGYTTERNQMYRKYAEEMEDPEKKEKVMIILDQIDEAYNLTNLKEMAKSCKIKPIELEKPFNRVYQSFLSKYKDSSYNIYDIAMARPILFRNLNNYFEDEEITEKDIDAFFICFCKQCKNMSPEIVTEHAYMYYVMYNIVLTDLNKGESVEVSTNFLKNVKEVICNLRERNNIIK